MDEKQERLLIIVYSKSEWYRQNTPDGVKPQELTGAVGAVVLVEGKLIEYTIPKRWGTDNVDQQALTKTEWRGWWY